jgi:hypothetical protein
MALRCFASDITTQYVFGFTFDSLGSVDFHCPTLKAVDAMVAGFWLQGHCSWLRSLTNYFSPWSLRIFYPQSRALFDRLEVSGPILLSLWDADDATRVYKIVLISFWPTILAKGIEEIPFHCLQH